MRRHGGLRIAEHLGLLRGPEPFEGGRPPHERFAGRIVVPELRGAQPIWLIGRRPDELGQVKYLALPGERPILGLERVIERREVFLTEGVFDCSPRSAGTCWPSPRAAPRCPPTGWAGSPEHGWCGGCLTPTRVAARGPRGGRALRRGARSALAPAGPARGLRPERSRPTTRRAGHLLWPARRRSPRHVPRTTTPRRCDAFDTRPGRS